MAAQDLTKHRIAELLAQAEASRGMLLSQAKVLRHRLDVPARVKDSLATHPAAWMLGTAGLGLLASMLLRRGGSRPEKRPGGLRSMLVGLALTAARPLLKSWLTARLGTLAVQLSRGSSSDQPGLPSRKSL